MDSSQPKYRYENVEVLSIYDADTLTVKVNVGFYISYETALRLARINAWEVRGEERSKGELARDYLQGLVNSAQHKGDKIEIETFRDEREKFGRYLAELWIGNENINDLLVKKGHARYQEY